MASQIQQLSYGGSAGACFGFGPTDLIAFYGATPIVQRATGNNPALAAYVTGAFGLNSSANMQALLAAVVEIRATLVGLGFMPAS